MVTLNKQKLLILSVLIVLILITSCRKQSDFIDAGSETETSEYECETKVLIDIYDNTKTKSYPDNKDGLIMYINDIIRFDISEYSEDISGNITQYATTLKARVVIKEEAQEKLIEKLNEFPVPLRDPKEIWLSDVEKYYPPGMDNEIQQELLNNEVIAYSTRVYSGLHGETGTYSLFLVNEKDKLVMLIV